MNLRFKKKINDLEIDNQFLKDELRKGFDNPEICKLRRKLDELKSEKEDYLEMIKIYEKEENFDKINYFRNKCKEIYDQENNFSSKIGEKSDFASQILEFNQRIKQLEKV